MVSGSNQVGHFGGAPVMASWFAKEALGGAPVAASWFAKEALGFSPVDSVLPRMGAQVSRLIEE